MAADNHVRGAHLLDVAIRAAINAGGSRYVVSAVASATVRTLLTLDSDGDEAETDLEDRKQLAAQALQAHADVHALSCAPAHNLGLATKEAGNSLTRLELKVLGSLRRKANRARHSWPTAQQRSVVPLCEETTAGEKTCAPTHSRDAGADAGSGASLDTFSSQPSGDDEAHELPPAHTSVVDGSPPGVHDSKGSCVGVVRGAAAPLAAVAPRTAPTDTCTEDSSITTTQHLPSKPHDAGRDTRKSIEQDLVRQLPNSVRKYDQMSDVQKPIPPVPVVKNSVFGTTAHVEVPELLCSRCKRLYERKWYTAHQWNMPAPKRACRWCCGYWQGFDSGR